MQEPTTNPENEVPEEITEAAPELSPAEQERDEYKDGWMRAKADLINFKRQEGERVTRAVSAGISGIIEELLLVLDSFTLARQTLEAGSPAEQGMMMIRSQLVETLKRYGLELIQSSELVDQNFDPSIAEAIGTMPMEGKAEGTVVSVAQDGYRLNGKVLRPARVYLAGNAPQ